MELIFLGTGTSQGVPMIAQPESGCDMNNPKNWRTRCSIHVELGGHHIQVDAAQEFRIQCLNSGIDQIDTFMLTHPHADHILGMDDLRRFCDLNGGAALPVYSSPMGLRRVQEIFPYAIRDKPVVRGYPAFSLHEMPKELELPGGLVESVYLPHGPMEVLGLVFTENDTGKKLAYFTDCKEVGEEARLIAEGADVVVLDGLRPEPHPSHMTIGEATQTALEMGAPVSFLTHMTYLVDHESTEAQLPENIHLAYDGLRVSW
ncbi:MBL fold metallo-hydrolase [Coraliomargarita akajimensis]|uniref:Beta-lactamase domain-containing protein n=1 Tax=Coraliomargarita akajimensis (strain DSM 45221 / IAM 15411 / JCM 23193 / KCTC 12865 / 04OKA010-24) TaxID=583355 RepID=D5EJ63_CORAD|nr:MBL fold metallo-hydrolase [Coraliomargarita akajimensis]ADE54462.1 beta-lactamase domain-containing protein [Coraliomargarita akajimensis DSM 45221]